MIARRRTPSLVLLASVAGLSFASARDAAAQKPPPKAAPNTVEAVIESGGKRYELVGGDIYEAGASASERKIVRKFYDIDYYAKHYDVEGGTIYRVDRAAGLRFPVRSEMTEDFEGAGSVRELIGPKRGWTGMTLLEPGAPDDRAMIRHRQRVIDGRADFMENRVEPDGEIVHGGRAALRLTAVPPSRGMIVSKASLDTALLHFVKGEELWFRAWVYIKQGTPLGLLDLECSFIENGPGLRILLDEAGRPRIELKWADKPTYRGTGAIARESWVRVQLRAQLSEGRDGRVELWFDDRQVIAASGQTLPFAAAVYDRMQLGITANPPGSRTVMYVDDVYVGRSRPR